MSIGSGLQSGKHDIISYEYNGTNLISNDVWSISFKNIIFDHASGKWNSP